MAEKAKFSDLGKPPYCTWCKKEKTQLPDPTDHGFRVFVCTEKVGKQKMPCDGYPPVLERS